MPEIETRLSYRLSRLTTDERKQLLERLGISRSTLWSRCKQPGTFTLDDATTIQQFLSQLDNEDYDMLEMLRPIQLT